MQVKVAMRFKADTAVELRTPSADLLDGQAAHSSTSFFFKTQQPDAMLYFIGGPTEDVSCDQRNI